MFKRIGATLAAIANYLRATDSYDIRRYLAMMFMAGGSMAMTILLAAVIFLLQGHAGLLFWIAVGLIILIGLQQTGFVALIAKRSISIEKGHIRINDESVSDEIKQQADGIKEQAQDIKDALG